MASRISFRSILDELWDKTPKAATILLRDGKLVISNYPTVVALKAAWCPYPAGITLYRHATRVWRRIVIVARIGGYVEIRCRRIWYCGVRYMLWGSAIWILYPIIFNTFVHKMTNEKSECQIPRPTLHLIIFGKDIKNTFYIKLWNFVFHNINECLLLNTVFAYVTRLSV